ncbi:MADS-box transcription factor 50 [Dendrobium catenatum]|uniref:MADS-box transcription factor 50 n=1 Tax=Dendrobium catenatum TaxID=906689 RepID=A0A2I0VTV4_9ASPA|nr:MADS-box transcription factor 50 [Dendrobium catenatum]XP_028555790.1 MADS-box transcription factor 50 [Dendrobium catenatum]XP_028555791.1 MADS-box transcription factor 50 [Dendrobium catenatum]XP_028555792.1 MADS-box transcription factor 50 [Dendrobium catenatum]XP_028555793.1 MADS-box transcription factor 50 [Dendrobium catenatum]XP_028555794.1 MADS-box transcription factor 50 [Dendrobium catenatum]PKU66847.1 MADS-box transcription factor 50 [Dendrobium catenatum]
MGENLESLSLEDLNKLEGQLEQDLGNIRGIKIRLLSGQVTHLKEKTRVLSEENELVQNQCKETQQILDSTRLVALYDNNNQHKEAETDLYIGCFGEDERSSNGRKGDLLQSEISNNKGLQLCFANNSMQNVIERYKMNLVDLSSTSSATEQNIQRWKQEAALNAMKIDFLEASNRKLMGENLESCSLEDLNKFECQFEQGLVNIRGIKSRLLSRQVTQLEEKTRVLSEENELLQNQCKETQLILDSTRLVALEDNNNQHKDVETDLYIGCPGKKKI